MSSLTFVGSLLLKFSAQPEQNFVQCSSCRNNTDGCQKYVTREHVTVKNCYELCGEAAFPFSPLHPNMSIHIVHAILYIFLIILTRAHLLGNHFFYSRDQMRLISDSLVILSGEISCKSLLRGQRVMKQLFPPTLISQPSIWVDSIFYFYCLSLSFLSWFNLIPPILVLNSCIDSDFSFNFVMNSYFDFPKYQILSKNSSYKAKSRQNA